LITGDFDYCVHLRVLFLNIVFKNGLNYTKKNADCQRQLKGKATTWAP
jgi:hypothetical protein